MPKFTVKRDTCVSHLSRLFKAGDIAEFEIPIIKVPRKDAATGRQAQDADGALAYDSVPMTISENLELIKEPAKDAPETSGKKK